MDELLPFVIKFKLCDGTRDFPLAQFSENIILMSSTPRNENNCSKLGWQQNPNKQAPIHPPHTTGRFYKVRQDHTTHGKILFKTFLNCRDQEGSVAGG